MINKFPKVIFLIIMMLTIGVYNAFCIDSHAMTENQVTPLMAFTTEEIKESQEEVIPNFKIVFIDKGQNIEVTNSVLPSMLEKMPYVVHCINLTTGNNSYEWFTKTPGLEYVSVGNNPNPSISINASGPTFIKLRINNDELFTKEYFVTTRNNSVYESVYESVYGADYHDSRLPIDLFQNNHVVGATLKTSTQMKITYANKGISYNVTNRVIPEVINELPYTIHLSNLTNIENKCTWYIKFPGKDYIWMDNKNNTKARIWNTGTVYFKLQFNDKKYQSVEYSVSAFDNQKNIDEFSLVNTTNNQIKTKPRPKFDIIYNMDGKNLNVANNAIPELIKKAPFTIYLRNLSSDDYIYQWLIKYPDKEDYVAIEDPTVNIYNFGTTYIKLKLGNDNRLTKKYSVKAFYSLDMPQISQLREHNLPDINKVPTANFKISHMEDGKIRDVSNKNLSEFLDKSPINVYLTNLSSGDYSCEWFIKQPNGSYELVSSLPSPNVQITQPGITYIKLQINNDKELFKEYSITVFSKSDLPQILNPQNFETVQKADLEIKWNKGALIDLFKLTLINETKRKSIFVEKLVQDTNSFIIPRELLDEGCKYTLEVRGVLSYSEILLSDKIVFFTDGELFLFEEPSDGNNTIETAIKIDNNQNLSGLINYRLDVDILTFTIENNSEVVMKFIPPKRKNYAFEILNSNGKSMRLVEDENQKLLEYKNVYSAGTYFVRIYNKSVTSSILPYKFSIYSKSYNPKALLLYVGFGRGNKLLEPYAKYTDSDIDKLLDSNSAINTKEFVILSGPAGYGAHEAIIPARQKKVINSIKIENNSDLASRESIKNEIWQKYNKYIDINNDGVLEENPYYIPESRTLESFVTESIELAQRLIKKDKDVKIWFSFPVIAHANIADEYTKVFKEKILKNIKQKLDAINPNYWNDNVIGFYYSQEDVPVWYTEFNTTNNKFVKTNPIVKSMKALSAQIHEKYNKMFLWIPYLGDPNYNIKRVGYIANATNIFDYVIIQPSRTFDGAGFISNGTGDSEINVIQSGLTDGKGLTIYIKCPLSDSMKIEVRNKYDLIVYSRTVKNTDTTLINFNVQSGIYTVTVVASIKDKKEIYAKSIFVDEKERWNLNLPTVSKSVTKNALYYTGKTGIDGEIVTNKSSKTKIGFEMEIDAYCAISPDNITPDLSKTDITNITDLTLLEVAKREKTIEEEMVNYYKFVTSKKRGWYNEYIDTFYKRKNRFPMFFYAGDRNELMDSVNEGITKPSTAVFDLVKNLFLR